MRHKVFEKAIYGVEIAVYIRLLETVDIRPFPMRVYSYAYI